MPRPKQHSRTPSVVTAKPRLSVEQLEDRAVPATLTLSIPATSMSEAAGPNAVGALLNRTGDLTQPLTVNLTSSDTTEATVPATVSFAAGQQEVGFSISAVDDALVDGTQTVTITGVADVNQGQPFGLDSSYGSGGLAPTRLDMAIQPPVQAIALQRDGKVIVASENTTDNGWHVQRFNTDGTLDTTFGGGLVNTTGLGSFAVPHAAVVQPDGKILIGGKISSGTGGAILVRYNPNGTLDATFGVGGKADLTRLTNLNTWVTDVALRADGRILLGLGQNGSVLSPVAQLNPNGTFDATFGSSGVSNLNLGFWAQEVEVLADGTFLVGGSFRMPVHVARVQPNGIGLVTSFGTNGLASLDFGTDGSGVAEMAVDAQGRIVMGVDVFDFVNGNSTPADFAAGRLNPDGTPDTSFAGDGTAVLDVGGSELATGMVVQQDGKVVLVGRVRIDSLPAVVDSAMVRFNADGTPDASFDGDGIYRQSIVNTFPPDQITNAVLQEDGKLLAITGWGTDWRIARFHLGAQSFSLSASDTINVLDDEGENLPPLAKNQSVTTPEDTPLNGNVVATDPEGQALTYAVVTPPAHGTLSFTASTGAFTYTPDLNYFGPDRFTFKASDGLAESNVATVTVTVTAVNDAPVAQDRAFTINEDPPSPFLTGTLLATDVDSASLTYSIVAAPANGMVVITDASTGAFTYRPRLDFSGTDTFTYKASDGALDSNVATVTVTVTPVNDAPRPTPVVRRVTTAEDTAVGGQLTAVDPEGDPFTFSSPPEFAPTHGTVTVNPDGTWTYTPAANYYGPDVFGYRVTDDEGASGVGAVEITVTPVNDAPVAASDAYSVDEDGTLTLSVAPVTRLRMVSEPGDFVGQGLTYDFTPATATFDADQNFDNGVTLDVDPPALGEFWFLDFAAPNEALLTPGVYLDAMRFPFQDPGRPGLSVGGNGRGSNTLTGRFTVFDVAFAGDAVTRFAAAFEQHSEGNPPALLGWVMFNSAFGAGGGVLANDTDLEGDLLLGATLVSGPANGALTFNGDGTFTYTPNANFHGTDTFTYRTNDGRADSNVATVTITVNPVNDVPVAVNDSYATDEDTALTVSAPGVLGNDTDVDNDALSAVLVSGPAHGTLTLNANGSFTYTPAANFNGSDSFTYKASDGTADSPTATVNITIAPVNDAPVAANDSYTTDEDTALTVSAPGVLGNDTDVEGDALTAVLVSGPSHGTLALNANGSFTYTPAANYNGSDSFTYKANDGALDSNVATVSLTINAINDAPVAVNDGATTDEDTPLTVAAPGVLGNDTDVDGDALSAVLVSGPAHGTLTLNANGSFTYTPAANYNGPDSFTYKVNDGALDSNVATVSITVNAVNDAPVAVNDSAATDEDTPLTVSAPGVLDNDTDVEGDALGAVLVSGPAHGTLALNANGSFTYTPAANYNGSDSFTYKANDGALDSNVATVAITVRPVNDAPVAVNDSHTTDEDTALTVSAPGVLGNDTDVDGDALSAVLVSGPAHGTLTLNGNGSFTYTPNANFNGSDSFTYKVNDGALDSNVATVSLTVNAVNDAPVAVNDGHTTDEDTPLTVSAPGVLGNDTDVDNASLSAILVSGPAHGTLALNANGSFTYTPAANYNGSDSFTYKANDGALDSNVATVSLTVNAVNDNPVAVNDSATTDEDNAVTVAVLGNDTDVDGDGLTVSAVTQGGNGSVAINADGTVSYTPNANFNGTDSFTYTIGDGNGGTATATVSVTVRAVNDAPVANDDATTTDEDTAVTVAVLGNDADVDGDALGPVLVSGPAHGSVVLNADGTFTYTPAADFHGTDSFTYKVNDGAADSNVATVAITVNAVNDAPVANDDLYTTTEGTQLAVAGPGVLGNDTDADGDALGAVLVSGPANGTLVLNADGSFVYTPAAGFSGTDSFTYRASDGSAGDLATVTIRVNPASDPATVGKLTGGGTTDRGARRFNIDVRSRASAGGLVFTGDVSFTDRENGITLVSTAITYFRAESDGVRATIRGTATVNGVAGFSFTIFVQDRGQPGRNDTFRIVITGPGGFLYDSDDHSATGGRLDTGNLQVHRK